MAATGETPDFVRLMREEGRAVVNISSIQLIEDAADLSSEAKPEDDLSDEPTLRPVRPGEPGEFNVLSLGSGFIISDDGYIVTNAHVAGARERQEIVVRLADRREFRARVVGLDRITDLALLKIAATGLPRVRVGDPGRLEPGEWVAAVGSPFGFERSITAGIVSAKGRALPDESYAPFIQTDVAVNPGNSGGPLFNLRGEVIGVNSVIYTGSGGYMGLSFAIPIDFAMEVIEQLRARGRRWAPAAPATGCSALRSEGRNVFVQEPAARHDLAREPVRAHQQRGSELPESSGKRRIRAFARGSGTETRFNGRRVAG